MPLKRGQVIAGLSVVHFAATLLVLFLMAADTASRFDTDAPSPFWSTIVESASAILLFPLVTAAFGLPGRVFAGLLGWAPLIANSVIWGAGVDLVLRWIARRRHPAISTGV